MLHSQISVGFDSGGLTANAELRAYQGGTCSTINIEGAESSSYIDLSIDLIEGIDEITEVLWDGDDLDLEDFITPTFGCQTHIFNVSGQICSYLVTGSADETYEQSISGNVNYSDVVEVFSPIATTIELPIHISASVAAVQTFCDGDESEATAMVGLTGSLAGGSLSIDGKATISGAFLDNKALDSTKIISVEVQPGINTFPFVLNGTIMAKSTVRGIHPWGIIACGSNACANAGNSITVYNFTGPNGSPLPTGMTIIGLNTGINYTNPEEGFTCDAFSTPEIIATPATCGDSNGEANIIISGIDTLSLEWSNGSTEEFAEGLAQGSHYVIVSDDFNCSQIFPFFIDDVTIPNINLPSDTLIDDGEVIILDATDFTNPDFDYLWSQGDTTSSILVDTTGMYSVTITDTSLNCDYTFDVSVISSNQHLISDGDIITNSGLFYDDGGPDANYQDDESYVITICPENQGEFIVLDFTEVSIISLDDQDELSVFDGTNSICALNPSITAPETFTASASSGGCLTVRFRATSFNGNDTGWEASISTTTTPPNGCFNSTNSCDYLFTDSGGDTNNYQGDEFQVYHLCPENPDLEFVTLEFTEVDLNNADILSVYDGIGIECLVAPSVESPEQFTASTNSGGCLTVVFDSDTGSSAIGWIANVSCVSTSQNPPPSCGCGINSEPANVCENAPLLNNLEAFCGQSSILYTSDTPGNLEEEFDCGIAHNNSFLKFVPSEETVEIGYQSAGGINALCSGFQLAVFSVEEPCNAADSDWNQIDCVNIDDGLTSNGTFEVSGLIPGETYYLMIDGSHGSECYYTLEATSGFAVCPLDIDFEEVECLDNGTYYVTIPILGNGDSTIYQVYEYYNHFLEIDTMTFIDSGVSDTVTIGPYAAGRDYRIIINGGDGLAGCNLNVEGTTNCPISCDNLEVNYNYECFVDSNQYYIIGNVMQGTSPFSIVSNDSTIVLFPDMGTEFIVGPFDNSSSEIHEVHITDINECYQLDTLPTMENFLPIVDLGEDINIVEGDTITFDVTNLNMTYSWSTGESTPTIRVSQAGVYSVTVTNSEGCSAIDEILVSVGTNVEEVPIHDIFKLSPNPGQNILTITYLAKTGIDYEIEIIDLTGKIIFSEMVYQKNHLVNTQFMPSGIYLVRLKTKNNFGVKKWIKQ